MKQYTAQINIGSLKYGITIPALNKEAADQLLQTVSIEIIGEHIEFIDDEGVAECFKKKQN